MHIFILPQWKQHLWKSKECFWKSRSCPIRSPRSFNAQRSSFHTFSSIGRDFTRYQLEKNSRGETKQEVIKLGQLLETGFFFFFFFFFEREREKKDRNMDATYFAKRTKLVSTSEVDIEGRGCCCALLHASKVYRACIYERLWSFQFERTREPATIKFPSKV